MFTNMGIVVQLLFFSLVLFARLSCSQAKCDSKVEGESVDLKCGRGEAIHIDNCFYGNGCDCAHPYRCNEGEWVKLCYVRAVIFCGEQVNRRCMIYSSNTMLGWDPSPNKRKTLMISYRCVPTYGYSWVQTPHMVRDTFNNETSDDSNGVVKDGNYTVWPADPVPSPAPGTESSSGVVSLAKLPVVGAIVGATLITAAAAITALCVYRRRKAAAYSSRKRSSTLLMSTNTESGPRIEMLSPQPQQQRGVYSPKSLPSPRSVSSPKSLQKASRPLSMPVSVSSDRAFVVV